ncbi:MAG: sigma-54 dependent transcriptional regulator [Alphaproteobacteria bacterium]|nr:sigma-54 dependent transcriptional regulator [Alphaproteobacteria bacterium]
MMGEVLVVEDDPPVREALVQTLQLAGHDVIEAAAFIIAKDHLMPGFPGVVLSDIRMPGRDGMYLLDFARAADAELPVILLTGEGDIPMAVEAMSRGAFDFLEKPCPTDRLLAVVERALHTRALVLENRALKRQAEAGDAADRLIFGTSALANGLRASVRRAAQSGADVLISGPPGSGISKIAEVLHLSSPRAKGPFKKRAADGLTRDRFEALLDGLGRGTLFLDDISSLPMDTQMALLDTLEARALHLVAGSTQDLCPLVDAGQLHADLFYRLDALRVTIPSLAERPEDIPVLFRHYVGQAAEQAGLPVPELRPDHLSALMAQDWPGNARSLMSAAMRFVLGMPDAVAAKAGLSLSEQLAEVERSLLTAALVRHNGRAAEAAKALNVPRKTFYDKLARYGVKPEDYRR